MSLSERDMGELLTLLRELNQKTESMKDTIVELRATSTAESGRLRETIGERFDKLFDAYKGFSGVMDRIDRRLGSFGLYGKVAVGVSTGVLAALIADILLRIFLR